MRRLIVSVFLIVVWVIAQMAVLNHEHNQSGINGSLCEWCVAKTSLSDGIHISPSINAEFIHLIYPALNISIQSIVYSFSTFCSLPRAPPSN